MLCRPPLALYSIVHTTLQIHPRHIAWLRAMGEELERQCDFSAALKYYYAGKVYFAKLDNLEIGVESIRSIGPFDHKQLYETICCALQALVEDATFSAWAEKHPGVVLSKEFDLENQSRHLKHCLNLSSIETTPTLLHVRACRRHLFWNRPLNHSCHLTTLTARFSGAPPRNSAFVFT